MKRGNWTDDTCYYVTVIDGPRVGFLAGPFMRHDDALAAVEPVRKLAETKDPWSHFYAFGTAARVDGYRESLFGDAVALQQLLSTDGGTEGAK